MSELDRTLDRLARRGRAGTLKFREALERHTADDALTESEASTLLLRLLADHGLPAPVPQYEIRDRDGRLVARADFAYPDLKIAIEYDSYRHHLGKEALVRDSGRRNAVVALGWLPITATANDLRSGGHRLAIDVQRARVACEPASTRRNRAAQLTPVRTGGCVLLVRAGGGLSGGGWRCVRPTVPRIVR